MKLFMQMGLSLILATIGFVTMSFAQEEEPIKEEITLNIRSSFRICFYLDSKLICSQDTAKYNHTNMVLVEPPRTDQKEGAARPFLQGELKQKVTYKGKNFEGTIKMTKFTDEQKPRFIIKMKINASETVNESTISVNDLSKLNEIRLTGEKIPGDSSILLPSISIKPLDSDS